MQATIMTAEEARKITEEANTNARTITEARQIISKKIEESVKKGFGGLVITTNKYPNNNYGNELTKELVNLGYKVELKEFDIKYEFKIRWCDQ